MKEYSHSGIRPKRFNKPDFTEPVPDMILENGKFSVNPEWEKAPYEECFFDKKGRPLKAKTTYEALRELRNKKDKKS
jgi:hypothetical protein